MGTEVLVRSVNVRTTEEQRCVMVGSYAAGIGSERPAAGFVRGVEHEIDTVPAQQRPAEIVSGRGCLNDLKTQNIAIETDRGGHVEHCQQRREAADVNRHIGHMIRDIAVARSLCYVYSASCCCSTAERISSSARSQSSTSEPDWLPRSMYSSYARRRICCSSCRVSASVLGGRSLPRAGAGMRHLRLTVAPFRIKTTSKTYAATV